MTSRDRAEYQREYGLRNRAKKRGYRNKSARLTRARALEVLGGRCVRCGFDDARALQVDHIDGGGMAEKRAIGSQGIFRRVIRGESGYQLLCANCNWIKRVEMGEMGHNPRLPDVAGFGQDADAL